MPQIKLLNDSTEKLQFYFVKVFFKFYEGLFVIQKVFFVKKNEKKAKLNDVYVFFLMPNKGSFVQKNKYFVQKNKCFVLLFIKCH